MEIIKTVEVVLDEAEQRTLLDALDVLQELRDCDEVPYPNRHMLARTIALLELLTEYPNKILEFDGLNHT